MAVHVFRCVAVVGVLRLVSAGLLRHSDERPLPIPWQTTSGDTSEEPGLWKTNHGGASEEPGLWKTHGGASEEPGLWKTNHGDIAEEFAPWKANQGDIPEECAPWQTRDALEGSSPWKTNPESTPEELGLWKTSRDGTLEEAGPWQLTLGDVSKSPGQLLSRWKAAQSAGRQMTHRAARRQDQLLNWKPERSARRRPEPPTSAQPKEPASWRLDLSHHVLSKKAFTLLRRLPPFRSELGEHEIDHDGRPERVRKLRFGRR
ncbi:hypothetical protein FJT64_003599 [Amphibalanus amphitrite]|uniref:Uncharacterized protein n=1 Tax=Amphibalanus amphitrite TaxID=1232801 RepID=A0A6A4W1M9_AMPAM|nr:hypothetical protein FJT64_003599 [Amphibalanus amphitrite]